ncbi:5-carboxymethyl-2-hydroxymuconate Delta-isomerase [Sphingomonas paucimobilis]|uniref:fumarylacetoacetate hydrolase family protein n=1 Tax=Sphingobium sp. DC-2 TaxID=1303256 RepID=UPI00044B1CD6|nr:fumarylacetoacetate hydrolase family protein [Sphingobium sp. DC-2]EZP71992.1 5-carboxymethyl-2-hydroxymuconate Delta-isomerase [Sphingomonas paucimobilis]
MTGNPRHFAIGTFDRLDGKAFPALVLQEDARSRIVPLSALDSLGEAGARIAAFPSVLALLEAWDAALPLLVQARSLLDTDAGRAVPRLALDTLHVRPPVDLPRQILCTGANYRTHVIEMLAHQPSPGEEALSEEEGRERTARMMDERARNGKPYAFSKLPSAVTGPFDPIRLPADVAEPDWELELAVVIGRPARHVRRDQAFDHIAGYAVANDVSARDHFYRPDIPALASDPLAGKSPPTFLPFGPWITPAIFVGDPQDLRIELLLNGETMQDGNSGDMIFDIARQIEYLSQRVQLLPGDVVCTGSPSGNGTMYGRFLRPGDVVEGRITGLGTIRNICEQE